MNLEDIVCSLEWAKKLKIAEIRQDSLFVWINTGKKDLKKYEVVEANQSKWLILDYVICDFFAAYTISEMSALFPPIYKLQKTNNHAHIRFDMPSGVLEVDIPGETNLCNVYAKMLLAMVNNRHMLFKEGRNYLPFEKTAEDHRLEAQQRNKQLNTFCPVRPKELEKW